MKCNSVKAEEVRPGDRIFHRQGYCEAAKWPTVTAVEKTKKYVVIVTKSFETRKSFGEGVAVLRADWSK